MKNKKITALFFLIISSVLALISLTALLVSANNTDKYTCLIAGLDYANENTDVLLIANFDTKDGSVSFIQIPRDTYYEYAQGNNKINGLYTHFKNSGNTPKDSLSLLSATLENTFGIRIDAKVAIAPPAFRKLVDEMDGVNVTVKEDMLLEDEGGEEKLYLKKGDNHLNGKDAEIFVRYRKGYLMGDLSRINAQKIFISAIYKKLTNLSPSQTVSLLSSMKEDLILDFKTSDFFKTAIKIQGRNDKNNIKFVTLPGEAVFYNGTSYYVLNESSSKKVLSSYHGSEKFDTDKRLVMDGNPTFENIYYDTDFEYIEYSIDTVNEITVK